MREEIKQPVIHTLDWAMRQPPINPMFVAKNVHKYPLAFCNLEWSRVTTYDLVAVKDKPLFFFLLGPKTYRRTLVALDESLRKGEETHVKLASYDSSHAIYGYTLEIVPLTDDDGAAVTHFLGIYKEVKTSMQRLQHTTQKIVNTLRLGGGTVEPAQPSEKALNEFDHDALVSNLLGPARQKQQTKDEMEAWRQTESALVWSKRLDFALPTGCLAKPITAKSVMDLDSKSRAERDRLKKEDQHHRAGFTEKWKARVRRASISSELPTSELQDLPDISESESPQVRRQSLRSRSVEPQVSRESDEFSRIRSSTAGGFRSWLQASGKEGTVPGTRRRSSIVVESCERTLHEPPLPEDNEVASVDFSHGPEDNESHSNVSSEDTNLEWQRSDSSASFRRLVSVAGSTASTGDEYFRHRRSSTPGLLSEEDDSHLPAIRTRIGVSQLVGQNPLRLASSNSKDHRFSRRKSTAF